MMREFTIPTEVRVTEQDISDLLVTAFDGGINYWCRTIRRLKDSPYRLASDAIVASEQVGIVEDETDTSYGLCLANVLDGISKAAKLRGTDVRTFIDNHDAEDADVAIQFAVFGEVIYG